MDQTLANVTYKLLRAACCCHFENLSGRVDFNRKSYSKLAVKISGFATNFDYFPLINGVLSTQ